MPDILHIPGDAMAHVDRIMMEDYAVDTLQLMELAAYGVADALHRQIGPFRRVVALAGIGGNGGDAMVAARLLQAWGVEVDVVLGHHRNRHTGITAHQLTILDRMGIHVHEPGLDELPEADAILDGLLGFSLRGDPRGEAGHLIELANAQPTPIIAIDVPSGLDATSGHIGSPCIRAIATVTIALAKSGLTLAPRDVVGDLWLADIGVPPSVYQRFGVEVPSGMFAEGQVVRLT